MYFSWRRSGKLLRTTMSIREYKPLYYFTWYSPIIIYSPVVPSLWIALTTMYEDVMKDIFRGTFVLAGITACALDGTFTAAFLRALYSTRVDDEKLNPELVVVARYGITSSVLCLSSFALYLVALTKHQPMRIYIEFAGHAILNFVHLTLFFMKVSLLRVKGCVDGSSVNDKEKFLQSETARLEVRAQRASFLHDMQTSSQLQQVTANCTSTRSSAVGAPSTCDNTARRARDSPEGSKTEHVASHGNGNKSTHALRIEKMKTSKVHKSVHSVTTSDRDSNNSRSSVPPLPSLKSLANSTGRDSTSTRKSSKSKLSMHTKKSTGTLKRESETEEPVPRLSTERARRFDPPNSIEESNREKKPQ
ncbi:hypothetical protein BC830DRAFT_1152074 [Chytriomyces sp. MP71]|nr:hypothetical protein BC830DRAFT_1152074 [Chytriomyces sp. MP71]